MMKYVDDEIIGEIKKSQTIEYYLYLEQIYQLERIAESLKIIAKREGGF